MTDMNSQNYFDKLLEKAVGRSVLTGDERTALSAAWHRHEKRQALHNLLGLLFLFSGIGILLGVIYTVPEVMHSGAVGRILSLISRALEYLYSGFGQFFSFLLLKAGVAFLAGIVANYLGTWLLTWREGRFSALVGPTYIAGAILHAVATGYLMMSGVIDHGWEELEVTSVVFWCIIPLIMTLLSGRRPLFYQLLTGGIIALHSLVYFIGVSGNAMIAFDTGIAAMLISAAHYFSDREPRLCLHIRYMSMAIICFLLYCTGFVWDLPAVLEFRGYIKPGAHYPTMVFLICLFALAFLSMAAAYFLRPGGRSQSDRQFALLLLLTLVFAFFATGIITGFVSVGHVFDLFQGRFKQSIFSSSAVLALFFSWLIWFLWCLWMLLESRDTGRVILAQVGVTAMLGSIEIRYVEICRNFSFAAGLVMLPVALILAAASARILRRWLKDLLPENGEQSAATNGGA